jgi:hypothetical protein
MCLEIRDFLDFGFSLKVIIKPYIFRSVGEYFADIVETLIPLGYIRYTISINVYAYTKR